MDSNRGNRKTGRRRKTPRHKDGMMPGGKYYMEDTASGNDQGRGIQACLKKDKLSKAKIPKKRMPRVKHIIKLLEELERAMPSYLFLVTHANSGTVSLMAYDENGHRINDANGNPSKKGEIDRFGIDTDVGIIEE